MLKPLRNPGQSLQERLEDILIEKVLLWLVIVTVFIILALLEWERYLTGRPPSP